MNRWKIESDDDKQKVKERKKQIQDEFMSQLGLIVDQPRQGLGNSNDGNTARIFFQNAEVSAAITGINIGSIQRFHVILQAISSGFEIKPDDFREYALETARLYVELYSLYHMPTAVHKALMHGAEIIENAISPIGELSEDAQEACNEYIKQYREHFSRKDKRVHNLTVLFCDC